MSIQTSLLCPIDFSPGSLGALHYALAIARRFHASLVVQSVNDPLLDDVGNTRMGEGWPRANTERDLRALVAAAEQDAAPVDVTYDVRTGKPARLILEVARAAACAMIVMSTHSRSGLRQFFFGATAERVLRETTIPVLLTPVDPGPLSFDDPAARATPMLVPVDFSGATAHQIKVAGWIADTWRARVLIGHVLEPIDLPVPAQIDEAEILSERHRRACRGLQAIAVGGAIHVAPEILIASGDPADEIARWVGDHRVGLLVMALHSDVSGGPRMGSVTYRAIAMSRALTLALPPQGPSRTSSPIHFESHRC